jgi:hypothetical protein
MGRDGEIVGLSSGESGRACESHKICGRHITVGDLVKFKVSVGGGGAGNQDQRSQDSGWNRKLSHLLLALAHFAWEPKGGGGKQVWPSAGAVQRQQ